MKHRLLIFIIFFSTFGCAGLVEMEAPVEETAKARSNIPNPHLGILTKTGGPEFVMPQSLTTDPEFILLSFTDWDDGSPILRIDQSMALQMGIDSLSYQSFFNQLQI